MSASSAIVPVPPTGCVASPPQPKRPCNRYMFFCRHYVAQHSEIRALPVPRRSALVRAAYHALTADEMRPWREAELADRQRYARECDLYKTTYGESVSDARKRLRKAQKVRLRALEAADALSATASSGGSPPLFVSGRKRSLQERDERNCFSDSEIEAKRHRVDSLLLPLRATRP